MQSTEGVATNIKETSTLDKLPYAKGASWDPNLACLAGTRATMLETADAWAREADSTILWLSGVAGSGKTAIAHTVAQRLHKNGLLGSSFFFDRDIPSHDSAQMLCSTIARDLANAFPVIADYIAAALEGELGLASAPLARQFEELISKPLQRHPIDRPFVVVIDALDESIRDELDNTFLTIFRNEASQLPPLFRIFVTSRPTAQITSYLSGAAHILSHSINIHSSENWKDVATFIDAQFQDSTMQSKMGPDGVDETLIIQLKDLAEGLFIWIVTVFNYLRTAFMSRQKLRALLSKSKPEGYPPDIKMDNLYTSVLEISGDWDDRDFLQAYDIVMGTIMAAKRPLSLAALQALNNGIQDMSPEELLERFGSVLTGFQSRDEPIRILHLSFREFITGRAKVSERTQKFYISEKAHSRRLAALCLATMNRELTKTISGTGYLAKRGRGSLGIPEMLGTSQQLVYCCESWIYHVTDVQEPSAILDNLRQMILYRLITWMEVVASTSAFRGALILRGWLKIYSPEMDKIYDIKTLATALLRLGECLVYEARFEEALLANQEVKTLFEELASTQPAVFKGDFASSLNCLSVRLSSLGRREEALAAIQQARDLYRALAAERPKVFNVNLALSLNNLSNQLSELGRREEALPPIQEAVDLRRALASERPKVFNGNLASSLNNLSTQLSDLGRRDEALAPIQQAVDLYRALAAERPKVYNRNFASALLNLSNHLSELGRREEALVAIQQAVGLRRALAAERPKVFNGDFASSLTNLSSHLSELGRCEEALAPIQQAVDLRRALAAERPKVFNGDFASSLNNLSNHLSELGRREEALVAIQQAVGLRRALAAEPQLSELGRHKEALAPIQQAVHLRRALAAERPMVFNGDLALSLNNLSDRLSDLGRREEALAPIQRAVGLYRALAAEGPKVFTGDLASLLNELSAQFSDIGRRREALAPIEQAVDLYRALAAEHPKVFNGDLAWSLNNLSNRLSQLGRRKEALAPIEQAVNLYRALAAEHPKVFNGNLALSLSSLSHRLSKLGRREDALAPIKKAVELYRGLAVGRPKVFNGNLAWSLNSLSTQLSVLGRREEASAAKQEANTLNAA
ncbi:TPR-like protein [Athelia psychrophila]|uniref:TPR-like protein n=1 Tax=Athelia psychrophila TaxID=1759441 RepID=A0A166VBA0_9AGAM|nr:TPR-like protein [Fibularhizoctonia sp. CBS 109695]